MQVCAIAAGGALYCWGEAGSLSQEQSRRPTLPSFEWEKTWRSQHCAPATPCRLQQLWPARRRQYHHQDPPDARLRQQRGLVYSTQSRLGIRLYVCHTGQPVTLVLGAELCQAACHSERPPPPPPILTPARVAAAGLQCKRELGRWQHYHSEHRASAGVWRRLLAGARPGPLARLRH